MTADEYEQREVTLNRFRRLVAELTKGAITRNTFAEWEIPLLLDFDACDLSPRRRSEVLRQYGRAVEKQLAMGPGPPQLLSHFLVLRERRRLASIEKNAAAFDPEAPGDHDVQCP